MLPNVKINSYQFLVLVILFTIGTSILIVPSALASDSKQDAWIAAIFGTGIGLLIVWFFTKISLFFPNLTFVQMNETLFGKWLGKSFSFLFVCMTLLYTAILLYNSGTFLTTHQMSNTPIAATNILMAGILVMGVRLGLETIARSAEIFIGVFFLLFIILVIFIVPQIQFENLQPVWEVNIKSLARSSLLLIVVSSVNAVSLLMIFPAFINKPKSAQKYFLIGNLIAGIVIIIITLLCILVLGADLTARQMFPSYGLAKKINIGNYINRVEALMGTLWIISLYFKMVLYFYASVYGLAQIFNLRDYRALTYPLGMIVVILSLIVYPNVVDQQKFETTIGLYFSLTIGFLLPLLMVIVYAIRKKQLKKVTKAS
ncbi:GerAB/ArcD/ProY family transporter [Psychrobacillus lasiicapitis]|uniref:Spore gernimation protein n=1 Tax=Psychrobacillus lasiicapitis TaxID=1636719 RepID=A0A544TH31_9BACI|nr:endospore germination permease [Psychrobacillus lasiicapitis]TQR16738.1 spore gernimation protein [Psychrobacillus lasiicapitis]GGA27609.1 germination protein [Psychrobacillus lasiicapitis]